MPESQEDEFGAGLIELRAAEARNHPTHFKDFLHFSTLAECQTTLDPDMLAEVAVAHGKLAMHSKDGILYPSSSTEWDELKAQQQDKLGFAINDMECFSTAVRGLKRVLERVYTQRTLSMGGYVSRATESVFPIHTDVDPVLALQIVGEKRFDFYISRHVKPRSVTLLPGEGLFIPRKILHQAQAVSDSIHLCVTLLDQ
jgi:hypothetical protein